MPYSPPMPKKPETTFEIVFDQFARGRWTASIETPTGPIMAIGPSMAEAKRQLDDLLMMRAALKFTNECLREG